MTTEVMYRGVINVSSDALYRAVQHGPSAPGVTPPPSTAVAGSFRRDFPIFPARDFPGVLLREFPHP